MESSLFVAMALGVAIFVGSMFFARYGDRVIEPEIKGAFAALLVLMWLADQSASQAVLPAFLLGLAVSRTFAKHRSVQNRFRVIAFGLLTPFSSCDRA